MLTKEQWKEFNHHVNGEVYTQVDDAAEEAMLEGVKLALVVLTKTNGEINDMVTQALEYLAAWSNWQHFPELHKDYWYWLLANNYGEEEADYLINEEGWKPGKPGKRVEYTYE